MRKGEYRFSFEEYEDINELGQIEAALLKTARKLTINAYAPYSQFLVGAVARLQNGEIITGTNQENASFPVGLCAERGLMAAAATLYPDVPIEMMAISYKSNNENSDHPISPCGMCRQAMQEFEERTGMPIKLVLGGQEGKIIVVQSSSMLLPLAFTSKELKK
jgi:cytidine deaminase